MKSSARSRSRSRRSLVRRILPSLLLWGGLLVLVVAAVYYVRAQQFDLQEVGQMPRRSLVLDASGQPYSRLHGQNRLPVKIDNVPQTFIDALLAREDHRFYRHGGVDPIGIARAVFRNLTAGSLKEGGSTITQQLARNSFELGGRNLDRKLLEAFVAWRIERVFTKRQILENYINRIYYGFGTYGLETASQACFGKSCRDLTLSQSALMAGLIRSPNNFSPLKSISLARRERNNVLDRMVALGKISATTARQAREEPITVVRGGRGQVQDNDAMDAVQEDLATILDQDQMDDGGLKIYTTIDPVLQRSAEKSLKTQLSRLDPDSGGGNGPGPLEGAVVIMDNRSGGIRALVGGRNRQSPTDFDRAQDARRQIGSAVKPFVYAAAYSAGLLPISRVSDGPLESGEVRAVRGWQPGNSDGQHRGILPASDGLVFSRNTMTVRVGEYAGMDRVRNLAARCGLPGMPAAPSALLGAFEVSPRDVVAAYTVLPNLGVRRQNYLIERIDDRAGRPIYRAAHIETRAMEAGAAWLVVRDLRQVMERGTAARAGSLGFSGVAGGKTGTTNEGKDAWFVGFTSALTCGVWVGFDRPAPIQPGGSGAAIALPVWVATMKNSPAAGYPLNLDFPAVPLRKVVVCATSNALGTQGCQSAGTAVSMELPVSRCPNRACTAHRGALVRSATAPSVPAKILDGFLNWFRKKP